MNQLRVSRSQEKIDLNVMDTALIIINNSLQSRGYSVLSTFITLSKY